MFFNTTIKTKKLSPIFVFLGIPRNPKNKSFEHFFQKNSEVAILKNYD